MPLTITRSISSLIREQFPDLYSEDKSFIVDFMSAYYEWMEQPNNVLDISRSMHDNIDIDSTVEQFIIHFKNKFMANLPLDTKVDTRTLLKHISEIYKSKGSYQSFKLLFRVLFDVDAKLYYPGNDILRASDGVWKEPVYLEVSSEWKIKDFVGNEIVGEQSRAKAFVDSKVSRLISGGVVDVLFISSIRGNFQLNERVTTTKDNSFINAPTVKGSLTSINITQGGKDNAIGDIFNVVSEFGVEGKARVTEVESGTGKVSFDLLDGGSGFTQDAFTSVNISDFVFTLDNIENRRKMKNLIPVESQWGIFDNQSTDWASTKTASDSWTFDLSPWSGRNNEYWSITGHATDSGGLQSKEIPITPGQNYRFLVPFKIDGTNNGTLSLKVSPAGSKVVNLDGTPANDTFMNIVFSTAGLNTNTWYLAVGYVYAFDHINTTSTGGVYEIPSGAKVGSVAVPYTSFKWASSSISSCNIEVRQTGNVNTSSVRLLDKPIIQVDNGISDEDFAKTGYAGIYTDYNFFDDVSQPLVEASVIAQTGLFVVGEYVASRSGASYNDPAGSVEAHGYVTADDANGNVIVNSIAGTWGNGGFIVSSSANGVISAINNGSDDEFNFTSGTVTGSDDKGFGVHDTINSPFFVNNFIKSNKDVYGDIVTISTGTGASFGIGGLQNTETLSLYTDFIGGTNYKGIRYLDIRLDGGLSTVGFITDFASITNAGTNYIGDGLAGSDEIVFKGGGLGTGANPTGTGNTFAVGRIVTVASDQSTPSPVADIEIVEVGKGYTSTPLLASWVITTTAGVNLVAAAALDYGYGLPKSPHADNNNIMDTALTSGNFTIGEITSLTAVNPGSNYNADPFVLVNNPYISGFNRRDLILTIESPSGTYLEGEVISQTVTSQDFDLTIASTTGFSINDHIHQKKNLTRATFTAPGLANNFEVGMTVEQINTTARGLIKAIDRVVGYIDIDVTVGIFNGTDSIGWEYSAGTISNYSTIVGITQIPIINAQGIIRSISGLQLQVIPLNNSGAKFTDSNAAPLSNILYLTNDETVNTTVTAAPSLTAAGSQVETFAKGRVKSVVNDKMYLKRTSFSIDFDTSAGAALLTGESSNVTSTLIALEQDGDTLPMGINSKITSDVSIANGIAKTLEVISSGFGYLNQEEISLQRVGHLFIMSGRASLIKQGKGQGFWQNTNGFLNADKYIHDNDYYQTHSYEIQAGISINKYKDIVKTILHTSGTKLFGKVIIEAEQVMAVNVISSSITSSPV